MKRLALATSGLMLAFAGAILADDQDDLKELEGTYTVVGLEHDGKKAEKELLQKMKVVLKGDKFIIVLNKQEKGSQIKVNASKDPHTIDLTPSDGPEKGKTFLGIYKLKNGELTLAMMQNGERPKNFASSNDVVLFKLKKDE